MAFLYKMPSRTGKRLYHPNLHRTPTMYPKMIRSLFLASASVVSATSLSSICSVDYIKDSLPTNNTALQGLVYGDVTTESVYNSSVEAGNNYPAVGGRNFCNVTVAYKHAGKNDAVRLRDLH